MHIAKAGCYVYTVVSFASAKAVRVKMIKTANVRLRLVAEVSYLLHVSFKVHLELPIFPLLPTTRPTNQQIHMVQTWYFVDIFF